jgi:hypothetical protein
VPLDPRVYIVIDHFAVSASHARRTLARMDSGKLEPVQHYRSRYLLYGARRCDQRLRSVSPCSSDRHSFLIRHLADPLHIPKPSTYNACRTRFPAPLVTPCANWIPCRSSIPRFPSCCCTLPLSETWISVNSFDSTRLCERWTPMLS